MAAQRSSTRLLERLVLAPLRSVLAEGEEVVAWVHVHAPEDRRSGIVVLTPARCIVHWTGQRPADVILAWPELTAWRLENAADEPTLVLETQTRRVAVQLPTSSKTRVRKASRLLRAVAELAPPDSSRPVGSPSPALRMKRRGVRGHIRRLAVTTIGLLLIVVGALFASPFVPGPGTLTVLAGLAVLATEYDWAKDLHHWLRRSVDRLRQRFGAWRQRRRARRGRRRP